MSNKSKDYKKFIEAYLTLTAPYLKLKYSAEDGILYYFYYNNKLNVMKLFKITENWDEILYFFDLGWIVDPILDSLKIDEFVNAILYSNFYNSNIITMGALYKAKVTQELIKTFCTQRLEDPNMKEDINYLFIDSYPLTTALVEELFPSIGLKKQISEFEAKHLNDIENRKISCSRVKQWCPKLSTKTLAEVQGILMAHSIYIKNTYKKSIKEYTKDTTLDTIIKNFRNYVYDLNFIS